MNVVFAGTPDFAAGHLEALLASHHRVVAVITQPDKPGKRGKKLMPSPVKVTATKAGFECLQPARLRTIDLEELEFDVLVVVAYGQILKPPVLALPKYGCINVHASILPRWRGAAPVQRAILEGDVETGITLIQMDAGLDTGDMLARATVGIASTDTAGSLLTKMLDQGKQSLAETLDLIESGAHKFEPQNDKLACYANKIEKGEALIDWQVDAVQIDRQVRAFHPEPVAYTFLDDKRVKVHAGEPVTQSNGNAGEILAVDKQGILVGCATGAYLITAIQLPMGKGAILKPGDVLNGWTDQLYAGVRLGNRPDE